MTDIQVDAAALAAWSGTLSSLDPIGPRVAAARPLPAADLPSGGDLCRAHADGLAAFAEAVAAVDAMVAELGAAVRAAVRGYLDADVAAAGRHGR